MKRSRLLEIFFSKELSDSKEKKEVEKTTDTSKDEERTIAKYKPEDIHFYKMQNDNSSGKWIVEPIILNNDKTKIKNLRNDDIFDLELRECCSIVFDGELRNAIRKCFVSRDYSRVLEISEESMSRLVPLWKERVAQSNNGLVSASYVTKVANECAEILTSSEQNRIKEQEQRDEKNRIVFEGRDF